MTFRLAIVILLAFGFPLAQDTKTVWDGVYSEPQAKRGDTAYALECASCHGPLMQGGEEAPPLNGAGFMSNWNGLTIGDLSERIRVSMPPANPQRLSRQQNVDIITYILKQNEFPEGKSDLPAQPEMLRQIRIESKKP